MMVYIFDTDLFSLVEQQDSPEYLRIHARIAQLSADDGIAVSVISYEEQTRGWLAYAAKSRAIAHQIKAYGRLRKHLLTYLAIDVLDFDDAAGAEYEQLLRLKLRIGTSDLKIAAITLATKGTLLSRNRSDFRHVPALRVEDWAKE